jgi:flavorubredoxin
MRLRDPYNARHSSVSWNLMVDPNKLLWIAEQHGHSVAVMLKVYARWTKGGKHADISAIRAAMDSAPQHLRKAA